MDQGGIDGVVDLVVSLFDSMSEAHARSLLELKRMLREKYGRRSEKLTTGQLELLADLAREDAGEDEPEAEISPAALEVDEAQPRDAEVPKKKRRRHGAARFPDDLPRETVEIPVPQEARDCPGCEGERSVIGYDTQEILDYTPASFVVREVQAEKRACSRCKDAVVAAEAPARLWERGPYGAGLVAHVLVSKFKDSLPLYRQRQIYKRQRVDLPRSTLGDLVARGTFLLTMVAERIRQRVLSTDYVETDDTGLRVLDRDHRDHVKRGHLWPYLAGGFAYFAYTPSRSGEGPQAFLAPFKGYVQVDGYPGYRALFGPESPRIEVSCMAHARRYFHEALDAGELDALEMLGLIRDLYRVEAKARELDFDARKQIREQEARPVLDRMQAWLETHALTVSPKSGLGQAIHYMKARWKSLCRYLDDGRLEIDNSRVERLIRTVAVGRKNYLFAGSDAGAERAAVAYTVIASAALHGVDPWAYLKDVLEKIAAGWPQKDLDALLPDRWREEHPDAVRCDIPA